MGDKLINKIGISSDWFMKDINDYISKTTKKLGPVYMNEGIPDTSPAERAKYLDKKLQIKDGDSDERKLLETAKQQGKVAALIEMEKLAVEIYF